MKFHPCPYEKSHEVVFERSPQRIAAARRAIQKDKDSVPLFPEMVKHKTVEERLDAVEHHHRHFHVQWRAHYSEQWREARRAVAALPPLTRIGLLRYWNGEATHPRDPWYLADAVWGILHRGENPWTTLREHRQMQLVTQGRLPRSILAAILPNRKMFNPWTPIRIRDRIRKRTSIPESQIYQIRIP